MTSDRSIEYIVQFDQECCIIGPGAFILGNNPVFCEMAVCEICLKRNGSSDRVNETTRSQTDDGAFITTKLNYIFDFPVVS